MHNRLSLYVSFLILTGLVSLTIAGGKWKRHTVIKSDAAGYYAYLPALLIYRDLFQLNFYPAIDSVYNPGDGVRYYAVHYSHEKHRIYLKYTYGVALFQLPAFCVAHALTLLSGSYPADGYSAYYQLAVALNTVLFAFLGLLVLRRFLLHYASDTAVALVLLVLAIGTNLFAQVLTQPGLSHVYLFFLYALVLYYSQRWHREQLFQHSAIVALALGLCLVTRPADVLVAFFPLLWTLPGMRAWPSVLRKGKVHTMQLSLGLCLILALAGVQLLYWKATTSHWLFFTYKHEYFDFGNWQIFNGLFSFRKGWFIYTPSAMLGFAGMWYVYKNPATRFYTVPFSLYFAATLLIVFSWWQWYYGGSFGCRVMVQSLALLALPLAMLTEKALRAGRVLRFAFAALSLSLICLNVFQTAQYAKGVIHWQKMNRAYYFRVFGKLKVSEEDKKLLEQSEELRPKPKEKR